MDSTVQRRVQLALSELLFSITLRQGRRVTLRVPDAHVVPGALMDLLSVSVDCKWLRVSLHESKIVDRHPRTGYSGPCRTIGLIMVEMVESQDPMGALGASHVTCSGEIGATLLSGSVATSEMPRVRAENEVVRPTSGNRLAVVVGSKAKDGLTAPLKSDSCAGDKRNEAKDDELCSSEGPHTCLQPGVGSCHSMSSEEATLCVDVGAGAAL